ncbi:hypothetical protein AMS68_001966 [Peltaster fructicola]|uniref:SUN-domain-containing protein n=1 Tax=Peltaster fructicola TaxID=286661 RepID=A0A6H0XP95_9PEZI|nr:hypothetical protein AMS68_001966 [Peltaster fructicola]
MKTAILALLSAAVAVSAEPHNHHAHQHLHEKRDATPTLDVVVPGPTVVVYELNGHLISEQEVDEGLRNGTLIYADNGKLQFSSAPVVVSSTSTTSHSTSTYVAPTTTSTSHTSTSTSTSTSSTSTSSSTSSTTAVVPTVKVAAAVVNTPAATSTSQAQTHTSSSSSGGNGVSSDFPDGQLDCSHFPSDYGAVSLDWLGLGGWTGVQTPNSFSGGLGDIMTQTSGTCSGSNCCKEGSYCSYACPAGYQKSQWPSTQGATGQSVGGVLCQNGKLHLTNSALSSKLCIQGASQVSIQVVNNLSKNVAVCRTDYPGTESMTIPIDAQPGTTNPVTCPDASTYYHWLGGSTSAQYYVNPAGVSLSDGCTWGSSANPWGNFAPMNLGVGWSNGAAWLSIFQNAPTTDAKLGFTVEIKGDSLSGSCKYSNGQYCGSTGCSSTGGCTVSLSSGTASFVFSN